MIGSMAFSPTRLSPAAMARITATPPPMTKPMATRSSEMSIACCSVP